MDIAVNYFSFDLAGPFGFSSGCLKSARDTYFTENQLGESGMLMTCLTQKKWTELCFTDYILPFKCQSTQADGHSSRYKRFPCWSYRMEMSRKSVWPEKWPNLICLAGSTLLAAFWINCRGCDGCGTEIPSTSQYTLEVGSLKKSIKWDY